MDEYYLYTFESTHSAIASDKLLRPCGAKIVPVPRFISASCGISVRIEPQNAASADELFVSETGVRDGEYGYYHITVDGDKTDCVKLR